MELRLVSGKAVIVYDDDGACCQARPESIDSLTLKRLAVEIDGQVGDPLRGGADALGQKAANKNGIWIGREVAGRHVETIEIETAVYIVGEGLFCPLQSAGGDAVERVEKEKSAVDLLKLQVPADRHGEDTRIDAALDKIAFDCERVACGPAACQGSPTDVRDGSAPRFDVAVMSELPRIGKIRRENRREVLSFYAKPVRVQIERLSRTFRAKTLKIRTQTAFNGFQHGLDLSFPTFPATLAPQNFRPRMVVVGNGADDPKIGAAAFGAFVRTRHESLVKNGANARAYRHQHGNLPAGEASRIARN